MLGLWLRLAGSQILLHDSRSITHAAAAAAG